jgi:hypothetical protein
MTMAQRKREEREGGEAKEPCSEHSCTPKTERKKKTNQL